MQLHDALCMPTLYIVHVHAGDSEVQRTMLELLNQLDGFEATQIIKVVMATNRIDILDQALLRPGRIDRKIAFPAPNEEVRERERKRERERERLDTNFSHPYIYTTSCVVPALLCIH